MRSRTVIATPEPDLTPAAMIQRARDMLPVLRARQDECEALGRIPQATHDEFTAAGFYRTVQPRRFGGYEFDAPTFLRVMLEISRGCPASGWVVALTAGHPMLLASFPEQAQIEAYGETGEFMAPFVGSVAKAVPVEGGYRVTGFWDYASGCDVATHFLGPAMAEGESGPTPIVVLFDRADFGIVDNWRVVGMQGTGSRRVVVENVFVPRHRTVAGAFGAGPIPVDTALYPNPMYHCRKPSFLVSEAVAVAVGTARGAIDVYEAMLRDKPGRMPPFLPLKEQHEYQEHLGHAYGLVDTAEAALLKIGEDYMAATQRHADGIAEFDDKVEQRFLLVLQQAVRLAWEAVDRMFASAGTSATREDSKLARHFRDLAVLRTHVTLQNTRTAAGFGKLQLGVGGLTATFR